MASRLFFRFVFLSGFVLLFFAVTLFSNVENGVFRSGNRASQSKPSNKASPATVENVPRVFHRRDLTQRQCAVLFPEFEHIFRGNLETGKFMFEKADGDYQGLVQGRIENGQLYILTVAPDRTSMILHQRSAILHQLHRALITSPERVPNTYFAFVVNDVPKNNSWSFARPNKQSSHNIWLMPSFAFWSWPSHNLGSMDEVLSRIDEVESNMTFATKTDQVVWRGTPWFNPLAHAHLRQSLLQATRGKDWADVKALKPGKEGQDRSDVLDIEDFCRYKYVIYTEGVTYSGRLPFHQACNSVLLTAPLTYLTTTAWNMKPIDAEVLLQTHDQVDSNRPNPGTTPEKTPSTPTPSSNPAPLLPLVSDFRLANAIYLAPDFSNLERTILFLRRYPHVAEHIARNQRDDVVGKGYLSPAAEACYWREMVGKWAEFAVPDGRWDGERGERFESWVLGDGGGRGK